ncbi:MAG TPA: YigZ family protein [Bacteroidales bacterium]|nr:YigZ family protein [Bacteroidales bacterium]
MEDTYRTLENPAEGSFREKGSRFLAFGYPVDNPGDVKGILAGIKKKYHDARHHCYAYRMGYFGEISRVCDGGEPSGTAGKPIYGQLLSNNLTNTLVVVVRYFGGVLLGTGGLINAYRSATADMLSRAPIVTRFAVNVFRVVFPYDALDVVLKIMRDENATTLEQDFNTRCSMQVGVRKSCSEKVLKRLSLIPGLSCELLQNTH